MPETVVISAGLTWHNKTDSVRVGGSYILRLEDDAYVVSNDYCSFVDDVALQVACCFRFVIHNRVCREDRLFLL